MKVILIKKMLIVLNAYQLNVPSGNIADSSERY